MSLSSMTPATCRAIAAEKLAEAKLNPRKRVGLTNAAEAWLLLAKRVEKDPSILDIDPHKDRFRSQATY